jgi:hypothetical protein
MRIKVSSEMLSMRDHKFEVNSRFDLQCRLKLATPEEEESLTDVGKFWSRFRARVHGLSDMRGERRVSARISFALRKHAFPKPVGNAHVRKQKGISESWISVSFLSRF